MLQAFSRTTPPDVAAGEVSANAAPRELAAFLAHPREADYPPSWYRLCDAANLRRGPNHFSILGKDLVTYFASDGQPVVLDNRCVHMGASLSRGCVVGDAIECPLHHWRFAQDGRCVAIPSGGDVPRFARQQAYPAAVRGGQVYFFNGRHARFPLPFFTDLEVDDLVAARPFVETLECPWYMVGANAVDTQHFLIAHDRRLSRLPEVDHPAPHVHRTVCNFEVHGSAASDWLTRRFGGNTVRLEVTDYGSTMLFAHSRLARAETFGMLSMTPISPQRTEVHVTVMARRSGERWRQVLVDPLRAWIRRGLIRRFLRSDVERLAGTVYSPHTLIEIDQQFSEYFSWLGGFIRGGELS